MSQQTTGHTPTAPAGPATETPTTQVARDEASHVGRTAADAGKQVAGTAKDQAGQVAHEARRQAKDLLGEARGQATDQARNGQQKAAEGLRTLATELHQMADGGDEHGPASDLAKQAAGRVEDVAEWLGRHEPGDLLDEVRRLARRRPGAFLVGAALAGVVAGRLTRGAVDANRDTGNGAAPSPSPVPRTVADPVPAYPAGAPTPLPYDQQGGTSLPPGGPLDGPAAAPRPYAADPVVPTAPNPAAPYPPMADGLPGGSDPLDSPTTPATGLPPAHAERPGATTVGEYVDDLERDTPPRHEDDPYPGGGQR